MQTSQSDAYLPCVRIPLKRPVAFVRDLESRPTEHARRVHRSVPELHAALRARKLPTLDSVPVVAMEPVQLRKLSLNHHGGYILSLIDGELTLRDLLDVSDLNRTEASELLAELLACGAVTLA